MASKRRADANPPYSIAGAHQFYRGREVSEEFRIKLRGTLRRRRIASALRRRDERPIVVCFHADRMNVHRAVLHAPLRAGLTARLHDRALIGR
jgi:hypothetical protein